MLASCAAGYVFTRAVDNAVGPSGCCVLAKALTNLSALQELDFDSNFFVDSFSTLFASSFYAMELSLFFENAIDICLTCVQDMIQTSTAFVASCPVS